MKKAKEEIGELTLFHNHFLTHNSCCLCGNGIDPEGFDYGIDSQLVCLPCVKKHKPKLIDIRNEALDYAQQVEFLTKQQMRDAIKQKLNETIEDRIMSVLDDGVPF